MTSTATNQSTAPWKKIVATGGIILGAGALITTGAFAVFTSSGTANVAVSAGQLDIVMSESYSIADIAPGDTVQRPVAISLSNASNDGDLVSKVRFFYDVDAQTSGTNDPTVTGPGESLVTGADGLDYRLVTCTVGWESLSAPLGEYTCAGTTTVTGAGKLSTIGGVGNAVDFTPGDFGVTATPTGTFPTDAGSVSLHSLIELVLPDTADSDYENAAASLIFTAAAIQRDGFQK